MAEGPAKEADLNGYDKHWFVKKERALEFRCETCSNILKDPQQIIICGHQFCRSCLPKEVKKCPSCDRDVKPNEIFPDEAARKKILALEMKCPGKLCKWKGTLQDFIQKHKNECPSEMVKCGNEKCKELVARKNLEKHLQSECEYRKMKCRHCEEEITVTDEKNHNDNECPRIPVECPRDCRMEIPKEELPKHMETECEKTLIECEFKVVGCEEKVERGQLKEHEEQFVHGHLSQAVLVIVNLKQQKQEMCNKMEQLHDANVNLQHELRDLNEREEERVGRIATELQEFKEEGTIRLDAVQKATEQNFENLTLAVEENGEFQATLMNIQEDVNNLSIIIPEIHGACLLHQAGNRRLAEDQEKLKRTIVAVHSKLRNDLANTHKEMERQLDALCQEHEMERTERVRNEAECAEEISKLHEVIAENRKRQDRSEVALTITKDEMKKGFSEQCKQMQLDYDHLSQLIKKEKQTRENDLVQIGEEISQVKSISAGVLVWKVSNVEENISKESVVHSKTKPLLGEAFYTDPYGYLLQPKIFFNGARLNDQAHISVFIQIVKGPFDPILKWPFGKRIRITLIEQESKGLRRNIEKILMPTADTKEVRRPYDDVNNGFGIYKFVSHEVLRAGRYVTDDAMFVKLEVLKDSDDHNETI